MLTCQLPPGDLSLIDDQLFVLMIHLIFCRSIDQLKSRRVQCQQWFIQSCQRIWLFKKDWIIPAAALISKCRDPRWLRSHKNVRSWIGEREANRPEIDTYRVFIANSLQLSSAYLVQAAHIGQLGWAFSSFFWGKMLLSQSIWALQRYSNNN